jgi:site-specific DNA-cytosine methylase
MLRAIRESRPRWVVGENVGGLINWSDGLVFEQVCADLEAEGYEVQPFVLPACGVNAPHRRDRVWFIAHRANAGFESVRFGGENAVYEFKSASNAHRQAREQGDDGREKCKPYNRKEIRPIYCSGGKVTPHPKSKRSPGLRVGEETSYSEYGINVGNGIFANHCGSGWQKRNSSTVANGTELGTGLDTLQPGDWSNFPTQSPIRGIYDGISESMVRNITPKLYATISERYTDKDLQEVREILSKEEIWKEIGRLYKIHSKGVLLKVVQLCSPSNTEPKGFSVFSEKASEGTLRKLSRYGTLANSPQGRELEKQFTGKFANTLPYLSHEIALVAMEAEGAAVSFGRWHRNESIKAYGNAIVPQVALQIFKAIQAYESLT